MVQVKGQISSPPHFVSQHNSPSGAANVLFPASLSDCGGGCQSPGGAVEYCSAPLPHQLVSQCVQENNALGYSSIAYSNPSESYSVNTHTHTHTPTMCSHHKPNQSVSVSECFSRPEVHCIAQTQGSLPVLE